MKRLDAATVRFGFGAVGFYLIFLIPGLADNFPDQFIVYLRQTLILIFGICVFTNWKGIFEEGEKMGPRFLSFANIILDILNIIFKRNNNNTKDEK